jgi:hypothetical protein
MQFTMLIEPFDLNLVSLRYAFQRSKPAGAMTCQHEVPRLSQACPTKQSRWAESQCARTCIL